jgi:hemolysin III
VIFATGRPNPWPATFGFHEVWHLCVVTAALCHWTAIYVMAA